VIVAELHRLAPVFVVVLAWGCSASKQTPVPEIVVDLGTVDVGDMKDFRASIQANERVKGLMTAGSTIHPNSNSMDLYWVGSGPGYMLLGGNTHHIANCDSFGTTASVMKDGQETALLNLKIKMRRAFQILPTTDGIRYSLRIPRGFDLPSVVDHSDGIDAKVVRTGPESAEMEVARTRAALVPGGMIRLVDWKTGDSQVVMLPLPPVAVCSSTVGRIVSSDGKMTISANGDLTPDKKDVEVVLDPPGAYEIQSRGYKDGKLTLTLQSMTRMPTDLCIGFKRQGKWVEIEHYQVDQAQN